MKIINKKPKMKNNKFNADEHFKPKNIRFSVDVFEQLIINDLMMADNNEIKQKLGRNLTKEFNEWITNKLEKKENISVNCKGTTRSGKSLIALKVVMTAINYSNKNLGMNKKFDTEYIVCGNQKEYRLKLQDVQFGDFFQIDENAFASMGLGGMTEQQQLKDIQNIIAKQNVHVIYITPKTFLNTGATIGLSTWGKDSKNWLSRILMYHLQSGIPRLLGYVVINIGELFHQNGCMMYREFGGCTNPNRKKISDIPKELINNSYCIPQDCINDTNLAIKKLTKKDIETSACPFYRVCNNPMCKYEHKKDSWIAKEMKGGLDERTIERYNVSLKIIQELGLLYGDVIKLNAKNGKELALKVNLKIPKLTNTKMTKTEQEEILNIVKSMTSLDFIKDICENLELKFDDEIAKIKIGGSE